MRRKPLPPELAIHGYPSLPRRNANGDRMLTVAPSTNPHPRSYRDTFLPMIRIRGRWLDQIGFGVGERVVVTVEKKRLVLTIED